MNRILTLVIGLALAFFLTFTVSAQSSNQNSNSAIPEKNGDYPDPEHPGLRVRVFVHSPKLSKPSSTQSPVLVCNLPDPQSSAVIPPAGWKLPSTWTYTLNPNSVPSSVGSGNFATIAGNAFNQWMNAVGGKVTISKTSSDTTVNRAKFDGKNIIAWGRTSGTALAVTYIWYYTSSGLVAETDTIFNQKFPWYWNATDYTCTDANSYDAQDILTHETGHWMGLDDTYTSSYVDNTMYGYGSKGEVKKDTLTNGDIQGVQTIYPN